MNPQRYWKPGIYLGAQHRLENLIPRIITYWKRPFTWMLVVYEVEIGVLYKHLLLVNLCNNQESNVKETLGTHSKYYRDISIFDKLLDKKVAYSRTKTQNPKPSHLKIF